MATPLHPTRTTPSPTSTGIRRTLTYSPTKKSQRWSRRITAILLGLLFVSVALTIFCTFMLIGEASPPEKGGLAFGTPPTRKRPAVPEHVIGRQPWIRKPTEESMPLLRRNVTDQIATTDVVTNKTHGLRHERNTTLGVKKRPRRGRNRTKTGTADTERSSQSHPRVVYVAPDDPPPLRTHRVLEDDPMLHAPPGFEAAPQDRMKADYTQGDCVPMHEWQTRSFPNCNLLHEYDLQAAGPGVYKNSTKLVLEDNLSFLGQGWFRHTWRLNAGGESVVLKTLRLEREFYDEFYDLHRRDAVAMERLTSSPFIMDIYGYCGQSALNELADFGDGMLASLEKVDRRMRGNHDPDSTMIKLQLATSIAVGVAHIHEIDNDDRPSMVHYDLNPRNVAIVSNGKPKINDFNIAEFLRWNPKTNQTCGFPSRLHEPWWRAPEEVSMEEDKGRAPLDEKVDVYALGSIIFHILTTHSPRGKMKKERIEEVRAKVLKGERPPLDEMYSKSKDPAVKAIRKAMELCHEPDPKKRGTSRQVADILLETLMDVKKKNKAKVAAKKKH